MEINIFFRLFKDNRYSVLALLAALEQLVQPSVRIEFFSHPEEEFFRVNFTNAVGSPESVPILAYSFATPMWKNVAEEWQLLRARYSGAKRIIILAGGPHPTGAVKHVLRRGADFVCVGEGEFSIVEFVRFLRTGNVKHIPENIYYYKQGKLSKGTARLSGCWETLFPFPRNPYRFGPIEITRGCPFKCKYCETPLIKGARVRHKKLDVILEAVNFMVKHNRADIRFITPNALGYGSKNGREPDTASLYALLNNIRELLPSSGRIFFGSFPSEVRPEFVTRDTVRIMKEFCNNKQVVVGAQSGSQRMLDIMNRGHTVEDVINACQILLENNFRPSVDFIFGLPHEQPEDAIQSLNLIKTLIEMGARIHAHTFMPLPGSKWAGKKTKPIPDFVKRFLESLIADGKLFGQWMHQERIGRELSYRHEPTKEVCEL